MGMKVDLSEEMINNLPRETGQWGALPYPTPFAQ